MIAPRILSLCVICLTWYLWVLEDAKQDWGPSCVYMDDPNGDDGAGTVITYFCSHLRGAMPYMVAMGLAGLASVAVFVPRVKSANDNVTMFSSALWTMGNFGVGLIIRLADEKYLSSEYTRFALSLPGIGSFSYAVGYATPSLKSHLDVMMTIALFGLFSFTEKERLFGIVLFTFNLGLFYSQQVGAFESQDSFTFTSEPAMLTISLSCGALWLVNEIQSNTVRPWLQNIVEFYTFAWVWPSLRGSGVTYEQLPQLSASEDPTDLSLAFLKALPGIKTPLQLLVLCCYTIQKRTFWTSMLHGWFYLTCMTLDPILLHKLLSSHRESWSRDIWLGVGLSFSMLLRVSCMEICFFYSVKTMTSARSALIVSLYKRVLGGASSTNLDLPNLMSTDCDKIGSSGWVIFFLASWSFALAALPFYLLILTEIVGFGPSLAGLSVLLIGGFVSRKIATWAEPLYKMLQETRDCKSGHLRQALSAMLSIKMIADEPRWLEILKCDREAEMSTWLRVRYVSVFNGAFSSVATMSVPIVIFAYVTQINHEILSPAAAFTTLLVISQISWSVGTLPDIFNLWSSLSPSAARLLEFFQSTSSMDSVDGKQVAVELGSKDNVVEVKAGTKVGFDEPLFEIRDELDIRRGDFVLVTGRVGSGKSAILTLLSGATQSFNPQSVVLSKARAYVEQKPFLLNGTVRENVTFGSPFNESKMTQALRDAQLDKDLLALPRHLETLVGDGGVQLSGGQRARVAFARALYSRETTDVFVLDDLLASVDGSTGKAIWNDAILGLLDRDRKTIILSSSFPSPEMEKRWSIKIQLEESGECNITKRSDFLSIRASDATYNTAFSTEGPKTANLVDSTRTDESDSVTLLEVELALKKTLRMRWGKTLSARLCDELCDELVGRADDDEQDASDQAEVGATISALDFGEYWSRFGLQFWKSTLPGKVALLILTIVLGTFEVLSPFWLAHWTESETNGLFPYVLIQAAQVILGAVLFIILSYCALGASSKLFTLAIEKLFGSPMSFFDSVPTGRLMNIMSGDMRALDESLPDNGYQQIKRTMVALIQIGVIAYFAKAVILVVPFLFFVYRFILKKVRAPSRDSRRIEASAVSPVSVSFLDALRGWKTIKAFGREAEFVAIQSTRAKRMATARVATEAIGKWAQALSVQTGCLLYFSCAMAGVGTMYESEGKFSVARLALLLTFAGILQRTGMDLMMGWTSFESSLVSIERLSSLLRLPSEVDDEAYASNTMDLDEEGEQENDSPHLRRDLQTHLMLPDEPLQVEFKNVRLRYRLYRPLVLKGASFVIPAGAKAAIMGRSGGGKSSLFLALLRVYPISAGEIMLGGIDVRQVMLSTLRKRGDIRVVLQEPLLTHPTLRTNIDEDMPDYDIRSLLRRVGLVSHRFQSNLDLDVGPQGSLLSVGERQLVNIARALARPPRLLLCDECTSSVDQVLDEQVHRELLSMRSVTILSILHRTAHLSKFDYIVRVDQGSVVGVEKIEKID